MSTLSAKDAAAFCVQPSLTECPGICPIPTVDGDLIRYATYLQAMVCALSLLYLEKPSARRHAYYVLTASSLATILPSFVGSTGAKGGDGYVSGYHALLTSYLMLGTLVCSAIASTTRQFFHHSKGTAIIFLAQVLGLMGMALSLSVQGVQANFGSQPACNKSLKISKPAPELEIVVCFAAPWIFAAADWALQYCMGFIEDDWRSKPHRVYDSSKWFWTVVGGALITAWIVLTERFVAAQTVPVLNVGVSKHQARLFEARVFALLWVSAHIFFRAPSKMIIKKLAQAIGTEVSRDDDASGEKGNGRGGYEPPAFP